MALELEYHSYGERDADSARHKVALRAQLASIRRIRGGFLAPPLAGMLPEPSEARNRSIRYASPGRSRSIRCDRYYTPPSCHSLRRCQQGLPPLALVGSGGPVLNGVSEAAVPFKLRTRLGRQ